MALENLISTDNNFLICFNIVTLDELANTREINSYSHLYMLTHPFRYTDIQLGEHLSSKKSCISLKV